MVAVTNRFLLRRLFFLCVDLMQLGPKAEDVQKPVNPILFVLRLLLGSIAAAYYVIIPVYMWIKDQIVPEGQPI